LDCWGALCGGAVCCWLRLPPTAGVGLAAQELQLRFLIPLVPIRP
jgi:hypothetical protein